MTNLQCRGTLQGNAMFTMTMTIKENVEHLEIVDMMLQLLTVQISTKQAIQRSKCM